MAMGPLGKALFASFRSAAPALPRSIPILRSRVLQQTRTFSQTTRLQAYRRPQQNYSYSRFQTTSNLLYRWASSPSFYYQVGFLSLSAGGFYVYNLEEVPVSGRRRFNFIPEAYARQVSESSYRQILAEYRSQILPQTHPLHRMVEGVLERLIPHSGLPAETNSWTVHVINDNTKNAFVLPGGHVFVFRGILDVARGEDGLAAVLGHEIAHNVANHVGEKMSQSSFLMVIPIVLAGLGIADFGLSRMILDLGLSKPNGRKQESEADYIGLMMMAEACFDPTAAEKMWARMDALEKAQGGAPPQFLSTHPASRNRMRDIAEWMPKAEAKSQESGCA
ncbi:hypothetical protein CAC42_7156 [Sphaceloma murrayae]|uniref:Peptidase M48 domain-containing protein n=1 Tax=Sphaceloma murrayae TaxID=2082308 RepID=A0A2K1QRI1_9PEZI|nr:hypothetical protein CAC42_7156 [Sphaceloma murrayae]